jgi:peptidyl-tRNA hydrolase
VPVTPTHLPSRTAAPPDRLYIAVRADLPAGLQVAQAAHAAFTFAHDHPALTAAWHEHSQYLVIVAVPDEAALRALADKGVARDIPATVWTEPDLDDAVTAVAFAPGQPARRLCANLPLAGRTKAAIR